MNFKTPILGLLFGLLATLAPATAGAENVTYLHTDNLGSPVLETDQDGNVLRWVEYSAYGEELGAAPADGPAFTSHYRDAGTGLVYAQQRYYDADAGRFLSIDPMPSDVENAWNFNRFNYAANNPFANLDPDGRACDSLSGGGCGMSPDGKSTVKTSKPVEGFVGIFQGAFSYAKGVLYDLPQHAMARYGAFGREAEVEAVRGEYAVIEAMSLIKDNPEEAMRLANAGWDSMSPEQQANLQGRAFGRLATSTAVTSMTLGAGAALNVGAAAGNVLNAGVDLENQGAVIRTIIYGEPE